jgi:hypothetical protein
MNCILNGKNVVCLIKIEFEIKKVVYLIVIEFEIKIKYLFYLNLSSMSDT